MTEQESSWAKYYTYATSSDPNVRSVGIAHAVQHLEAYQDVELRNSLKLDHFFPGDRVRARHAC